MKTRKRGRPRASAPVPPAKKQKVKTVLEKKAVLVKKAASKKNLEPVQSTKPVETPARKRGRPPKKSSPSLHSVGKEQIEPSHHAPEPPATASTSTATKGAVGRGLPAKVPRDSGGEGVASDASLSSPEKAEHNYSKNPKEELMKLNLPIYACSMCKRYTYDPQQSALHARQVHNAKVGVVLMLPMEHMEVPTPSRANQLQEAPAAGNAGDVGANQTPPRSGAQSPEDDEEPEDELQPLEMATEPVQTVQQKKKEKPISLLVDGGTRSEHEKLLCDKCNRQFDRQRQMSMHKCIDIGSRRASPRRGEEGTSPRRGEEGTSPRRGGESMSPRRTESPRKRTTVAPTSPRIPVVAVKDLVPGNKYKGGVSGKVARKSKDKDAASGEGEKMDISFIGSSKKDTDKRGTWKLCKKMDESGVKWEAMKVADFEPKLHNAEEDDGSGSDDSLDKDPEVAAALAYDDDEDFAEDEDIAVELGEDHNLSESEYPMAVRGEEAVGGEDEMEKLWKDKDPPSPEELNVYIKTVHGGLPSGNGQSLEFYMCVICRKVFKTKNVLKPHICSHLGYRPFKCSKCGFKAPNVNSMNAHSKKHTGTDNEFKCWHGGCTFIGESWESLEGHRKSHLTAMRCVLCTKVFHSLSTILGHLYTQHAEDIKDGKGKEFYTKMSSIGKTKSQIVLFECDICGIKCKTKRGYYSHIRIHRGGRAQPETPKTPADPGSQSNTLGTTPFVRRRGRYPNAHGPKQQQQTKVNCPLCDHVSSGVLALKNHMLTHPFVYRCCMCDEKFLTYGTLNEHVGSHRNEAEEFNPQEKINDSLRKSMYLGGQMDKALEADKMQWAQRRTGALAPQSAITGSVFDELMSKISIPSEEVPSEELEQLGHEFTNLSYKRLTPSILRYIHLRFGNVECGVCGKLFPKVGLCKDHTKKHTKVKEHKCTECSFQGTTKATLDKHLSKIHNIGDVFSCEVCKTDVIGKEAYKEHMRNHMKENNGPFTCTWCNTTEMKRDDMKSHITNMHPMMPLTESQKIMGTGVVVHREKGAPFLVCEVCNATFRRICDLRRHMWKHSSVKRFSCDLCDYGSDKRGNIITHMMKHSKEKEHGCDVCGKRYKTEQSLKLHIRTAHLKVRPFRCVLCDYAAAQPVHLRRHIALHHGNGERRKYRCAICPDYKAADLQVVKRHYMKKHPDEKMNLSKCCPPDAQNPCVAKKDKHQVIQVVPSVSNLPADAPANSNQSEMAAAAEGVVALGETPGTEEVLMDQEQPLAIDTSEVEIHSEQHPQLSQDMTVEVVLPEDHAQLIDINAALPDVINALAALQESEFNSQ